MTTKRLLPADRAVIESELAGAERQIEVRMPRDTDDWRAKYARDVQTLLDEIDALREADPLLPEVRRLSEGWFEERVRVEQLAGKIQRLQEKLAGRNTVTDFDGDFRFAEDHSEEPDDGRRP